MGRARPPNLASRHSAPVSLQHRRRSRAADPSPRQRGGRKPLPGHAADPTGGGRRAPGGARPDREVRPPPELRRSSMAQPGPTAPAPRGWPYHCGAGGMGVFFIGCALAQPAAFPSEMPGGQTEQRSIPAVARAADSAGRGCPSSSSACP